ncbi:UPF0175 family protein [Candidatus Peregrinibacteria bacterium]|nr:UPF0175 family protein [Candidatus Peregrinibacteria bacterium]
MTKIITTRVDTNTAARLEQAITNAHTDKATFIRVLITRGLNEVETEDSLKRYKNGEISLGKMSELLNMTKWDALDMLRSRKIAFQLSEEDIREDLEAL